MLNTIQPQPGRNPNYVAVNEQIDTAGAIVWWRMSGPVTLSVLKMYWREAGLNEDLLPKVPSPADALRRTCMDLQEARLLMRPLGRGKGFAIVREITDDQNETLNHDTIAVVQLDDQDELTFKAKKRATIPTRYGMIPEEMPEELDIQLKGQYLAHRQALSAQDISQWVIKLLDKIRAVGLRQRGGIYFVPNPAIGVWDSYCAAIEKASNHLFFCVPAMHSDSAVEAILDAVEREAQTLAHAIQRDLQGNDIQLGKAALMRREEALMRMEEKLKRYEELLGKKSDSFPGLKEEVQAGITRAIFALNSDAQQDLAI